jgi:hypothetical protein
METMEEYKHRILSYLDGKDPLDLQAAMPSKLAALLHGVPHDMLTGRPAPKKWSIAEIVAHLVDDELVGAYRIRMILGTSGTPIQAFDQDAWATLGKYAERDTQQSLAQFQMLREMNLALFASLDATQWQQYGVHTERGVETIADIAAYYAGHDLNHLQQIEAILGQIPSFTF